MSVACGRRSSARNSFMLPDLLRYHRSDVALVRIITPLNLNATDATKTDLFQFVRSAFPLLSDQFSSIR